MQMKFWNDLGKPGSLCFITQTDDDGECELFQHMRSGLMHLQEALMRSVKPDQWFWKVQT